MTYPQGYMNRKLYKNIINQLPNSTVIVPFFRGESTLHKHFPAFMQQLKRFKAVQLATNGDFLNYQNKKAILQNVTFFSLSLHEESHPNHKQLRFLKKLRAAGVETQVSFVGELENRIGFVSHWRSYIDRIRLYTPHSTDGFGNMQGCNPPLSTCNKPFEDMIIYWDGGVGMCNHDWDNLTVLGRVNGSNVVSVFNNQNYETVRRKHLKNERQQIPTCKHCSFEKGKIYGEIIQCNI